MRAQFQCSRSLGGYGSFPGGTVSFDLIRPSMPLVVSSPPPWFLSIPRAALIASSCLEWRLEARLASLRLLTHAPSVRRETVRPLFLLIVTSWACLAERRSAYLNTRKLPPAQATQFRWWPIAFPGSAESAFGLPRAPPCFGSGLP